MAKGKSGGNRYGRKLANSERIGAGKVETKEQIIARGPNTYEKAIQDAKAKGPTKDKE